MSNDNRVDSLILEGREIGPGHPPYVIAEVSANHLGSRESAIEIIRAAAHAGADAIKLQHYTPETITVRSEHPDFRVQGGTLWDGRQLADLYAEAMTPWEWTADLVEVCNEEAVAWLSTPFDETAVDFLQELDVPAFKVASFEIIDLPLIRKVAAAGKPVIISSGMATVGEIDAAVTAALESGPDGLALLRCNSGYPANPSEMDLRAISTMSDLWGVPVGLSDHTLTNTASIAAVALGACIIEKHVTLRRSDGGPDAAFSLEPHELARLVADVREAYEVLGSVRFGPSDREVASRRLRPSLRAVREIAVGEKITNDNVRSVRPAGGLPPDEFKNVVGKAASHEMMPGDPLRWDDIRSSTDE